VFDELFGLPAHPLMVHAPVVLIPFTVLVAVIYGLIPPVRQRLGLLLILLALAGAGTAYGAVESGKRFAIRQGGVTPVIAEHQDLGEMLRNVAGLLALVVAVLVIVDRARNRRRRLQFADDGSPHTYARARSGGLLLGAVSIVLTLGLLGVAGGAAYYVARTGHTGAKMVWEPTP
jgi:uncharacterized membrane protein